MSPQVRSWTITSITTDSWRQESDRAIVSASNYAHDECLLHLVRHPDGFTVLEDSEFIWTSEDWWMHTTTKEVENIVEALAEIELRKWDEECRNIEEWVQPDQWNYPRGLAAPEELYASVAYLYAKLMEMSSKRINEQLALRMRVPASTSKERLRKARELGFLSAPGKGTPTSVLLPSATKVLREIGKIQ